MGKAKDIIVKPISSRDARKIIERVHYSGKVVNNSKVHLGVFIGSKCCGAMQFGPSLFKRGTQSLVEGTGWNEFIELNRMAFSDALPRNSESRALGFSMRWLQKKYPWLKWVVSFADGTQCGDGTIYRASGFLLTQIKRNSSIWINNKTGEVRQNLTFYSKVAENELKGDMWSKIPGHMLRYIYFLDRSCRDRLTVPVIPYSEIKERGAAMYRGRSQCAGSIDSDALRQPSEIGRCESDLGAQ